MNFRSEIKVPSYPFTIDHQDQLFSVGSCFADHIGGRLAARRFQIENNPFGILYNPVSIKTCLEMLLENHQFSEKDIFQHQELWHSYHHHGQFSHIKKEKVLEQIQQQIKVVRKTLLSTNRLFITLGTAQVYIHNEMNKVVANCHKLPQQQFTKRRLSIQEIIDSLGSTLTKIKSHNPDLQCIMTVSPVRHLRDGLIENQKSKAALILAIDVICNQLNYAHYFPAYEMLMDDLRDYRFYKNDLMHPTVAAQDYVWQHFQATFFDQTTRQLTQRIEKMLAAIQHRPLHPNTNAHQKFRTAQLQKVKALKKEYPYLNLSEWEEYFIKKQEGV